MSRLKYYAVIATTVVGILFVGGLGIRHACRSLPEAAMTLGVQADDFKKPVETAMELMNRFVGCEFLVPIMDGLAGDPTVLILSADGEPCGLAFHTAIDDGHSATSYQCDPSKNFDRPYTRYEAHISKPGDVHTQVCIVAHELGHIAGLKDHERKGKRGIMNQYYCPTPIVLSDAEVDYLSAKFCK